MSGTFRTLPGSLLLVPDADYVRSKMGIWYPDSMRKKSEWGLVVFHEPCFLDECLENKRVLVEKWAWRVVPIEGIDFYVVDERSVYAVLEEKPVDDGGFLINNIYPDDMYSVGPEPR